MDLSFQFKGEVVKFQLILSKRKTISIEVLQDGAIKVRAPIGVDKEKIIEQVIKKGEWIIAKRAEVKERFSNKPTREFKNGEKFMYLGKEYSLKVIIDNRIKKIRVSIIEDEIIIETYTKAFDKIKKALELWYRDMAIKKIRERVKHYEKYYPMKPKSIRVKEQKRRWGSCTYYNDLLFNWRIIMAPVEVIDYVVVHEMTHMVHKNHSKDYWNEVSRIMMDYKSRSNWLKENGIKLDIES